MKKIIIIFVLLFSFSLLAETKYTDKKILMDKQWSTIIGNNLSWVASCGETKFRSKKVKEIKSLSKYDYKNILKGIAKGTGTGSKVAIGCNSSAINQTRRGINDYVSELTRLVNIVTNGNIKKNKNKEELKKNNNEGSGPITFAKNFQKRFSEYLNHIKNEPDWRLAFAVHPDGANDWVASSTFARAEKKALENCFKKAGKKECYIFARGDKIVWDWDSMPNLYHEDDSFVDWRDVVVVIGSGDVSLDNYTQKKFEEYLTIYSNNKDVKEMYFAVSADGMKSGDMEAILNNDGSLNKNLEKKIKAMAIAECMSNNNKQPCYLYAINDKIVWNFPKKSSDNQFQNVESKLIKLKLLFDQNLITQDEYDAKKKEILDAI